MKSMGVKDFRDENILRAILFPYRSREWDWYGKVSIEYGKSMALR